MEKDPLVHNEIKEDFVITVDGISYQQLLDGNEFVLHEPVLLDEDDFVIPRGESPSFDYSTQTRSIGEIEGQETEGIIMSSFESKSSVKRGRSKRKKMRSGLEFSPKSIRMREVCASLDVRENHIKSLRDSGRNVRAFKDPQSIVDNSIQYLGELTDMQRWVITNRYGEVRHSQSQLALMANCTIQNISSLEQRALRRLDSLIREAPGANTNGF